MMLRAALTALTVTIVAATAALAGGPTLEIVGSGVAGGLPDRLFVAVEVGVRGDAPPGTTISQSDVGRVFEALVAAGMDRRSMTTTIREPGAAWLARSRTVRPQRYGVITIVLSRPAPDTLDTLINRTLLKALEPLRTGGTYASYQGGWYQRDDCEPLRRAARADAVARSRASAESLATSAGERVVAEFRVEETSQTQPGLDAGYLCGRGARPGIPPPGIGYVEPAPPRMNPDAPAAAGAFIVHDTVRVTWSVAPDPNATPPSLPPLLSSFNQGVYLSSPSPLPRGVVRTSAAVSAPDAGTRGDCYSGGATPYAIALAERYARALAGEAHLRLGSRTNVVDRTVTPYGCPPPKFPLPPIGGAVTVSFNAQPAADVSANARIVDGTGTAPVTLSPDVGRFQLTLSQDFPGPTQTFVERPLAPEVTTNAVAAVAAALGVPPGEIAVTRSAGNYGNGHEIFGHLYGLSLVVQKQRPTPEQRARFDTAAHDLALRSGLRANQGVAYALDDCLAAHDRAVAAAFAAAREAASARAGRPVGAAVAAEEIGSPHVANCGPGVLGHFELWFGGAPEAAPPVTVRTTVHALFAAL